MLPRKQIATNIGVGLGIVLQVGGRLISSQEDPSTMTLGAAAFFAGMAFFVWGCVSYAQGKGYSGAWGLLGLLSCLGLLVLVLMPDQYKNGSSSREWAQSQRRHRAPRHPVYHDDDDAHI